MLSKDASARPADGKAVADALRSLGAVPTSQTIRAGRPALGSAERVVTAIMAMCNDRLLANGDVALAPTVGASVEDSSVIEAVRKFGGHLNPWSTARLSCRSWEVTRPLISCVGPSSVRSR